MFDTVKVTLDGEEIELVPSLGAMEMLSSKYGPFQNILDGIASLNYNLYVDMIIAGVLPKKADPKSTKQAVFEVGMIELMPKLASFATLLMNGGKTPKEDEEGDAPLASQ